MAMLQIEKYISVKAVRAVRTEINVIHQNTTEKSGFRTS